MAEERRKRAALRERAAESIVCVLCYDVAVRIKVARDIADVVIIRDIGHTIDGQVKQPAHTARTLQRT